jgi:hypothetical protein
MGGVLGLCVLTAAGSDARATRQAQEYRYFRALAIDLEGRIPTPAELAAFERPGFDLDRWINDRLQEGAYARRVRRIYMDALRLDVGPSVQFTQASAVLHRVEVQGPDGHPLRVFYRQGQRRTRVETDGDFCLTRLETGLMFPRNAAPTGTPHAVSQAALDQFTVAVHRFMKLLGCEGREGLNYELIDLLDADFATQVLFEYGRAYRGGALSVSSSSTAKKSSFTTSHIQACSASTSTSKSA